MKLVRGDQLTAEQARRVFDIYVFRWTSENPHRPLAFGRCPCCKTQGGMPEPTLRDQSRLLCRQYHPVIALQTDEAWLKEHAFWIEKNGEVARRSAEPSYLAD
jgi:hypothetical protein